MSLIDLFDKMILPACTYKREICGASFFSTKSHPTIFYQRNNAVTQQINSKNHFWNIFGACSPLSKWAGETETNRKSAVPLIIRRMIGFYNHLKNSESPIILDSLQLSMEVGKDDKTSWFTSMAKGSENLYTPG